MSCQIATWRWRLWCDRLRPRHVVAEAVVVSAILSGGVERESAVGVEFVVQGQAGHEVRGRFAEEPGQQPGERCRRAAVPEPVALEGDGGAGHLDLRFL